MEKLKIFFKTSVSNLIVTACLTSLLLYNHLTIFSCKYSLCTGFPFLTTEHKEMYEDTTLWFGLILNIIIYYIVACILVALYKKIFPKKVLEQNTSFGSGQLSPVDENEKSKNIFVRKVNIAHVLIFFLWVFGLVAQFFMYFLFLGLSTSGDVIISPFIGDLVVFGIGLIFPIIGTVILYLQKKKNILEQNKFIIIFSIFLMILPTLILMAYPLLGMILRPSGGMGDMPIGTP